MQVAVVEGLPGCDLREVPVAISHRLERAAVNGDAIALQQADQAAHLHELRAGLADRGAIRAVRRDLDHLLPLAGGMIAARAIQTGRSDLVATYCLAALGPAQVQSGCALLILSISAAFFSKILW